MPSAPEGIAYYSPKFQANQYDDDNRSNQLNEYGATSLTPVNKKPPVLLIGNFPPHEQKKNNEAVTFSYIPQTTPSTYENFRYPSSFSNDNEYGKLYIIIL